MASEKETIILDFQVQQGDALKELETTKKAILQIKQEQKQLNEEYKKTGDLDKFVQGQVRLEAALKKQTAAYNNVQRSITGLKNPFDKLNESIKEQAKQVTIAGVSLTSFANPVTGTVAVLGLLGKAYASSTIGAKDLEFASNQLGTAITLLTNDFASLFSSAEDGEGIISRTLNAFLTYIDPATAAVSKYAAQLKEDLQDVRREELTVQAQVKDRLAENSELKSKIAQEDTKLGQKLEFQEQIVGNLINNQVELVAIKQKEFDIATKLLATYKENDSLKDNEAKASVELADAQKQTEKLLQAEIRAKDNILELERKKLDTIRLQNAENENSIKFQKEQKGKKESDEEFEAQQARLQAIQDESDANFELTTSKIELEKETADLTEAQKKELAGLSFLEAKQKTLTQAQRDRALANEAISNSLTNALGLFEKDTIAYKAIAYARAVIDTYRSADLALATYPPPFGAIAAGVNIAVGLANVAKISAAAGGGSFVTKGPAVLLVGDNPGGIERVEVTPMSGTGRTKAVGNLVQMGGGGTLMADGGVTKDAMTRGASQRLSIPVPRVVVQWRDYTDFRDKKAIQTEWVEV